MGLAGVALAVEVAVPSLHPQAVKSAPFVTLLVGVLALAMSGRERLAAQAAVWGGGAAFLLVVATSGGPDSPFALFVPLLAMAAWGWLGRGTGVAAVGANLRDRAGVVGVRVGAGRAEGGLDHRDVGVHRGGDRVGDVGHADHRPQALRRGELPAGRPGRGRRDRRPRRRRGAGPVPGPGEPRPADPARRGPRLHRAAVGGRDRSRAPGGPGPDPVGQPPTADADRGHPGVVAGPGRGANRPRRPGRPGGADRRGGRHHRPAGRGAGKPVGGPAGPAPRAVQRLPAESARSC